MDQPALLSVQEVFARRVGLARGLTQEAERVARTRHAMATRFHRGGRLIVFGNGEAAKGLGPLMPALAGEDGGQLERSAAADHVLVARSSDPRVVKEVHVTTCQILWELVHVFFEQPGVLDPQVVA